MSPPACFPGALQPLTSENLQAVSSSPASPTALYYSIEQAPRLGRLRTARGDEVRNFTQAQVRSRLLQETLHQPHSSGVPPHLLGEKLLPERCLLGGAKPSPHGAHAGSSTGTSSDSHTTAARNEMGHGITASSAGVILPLSRNERAFSPPRWTAG